MPAGDFKLLRAFLEEGDESALRELADRHLRMVHGVAFRILRDSALAEDVAQRTFSLLARKGASIRPQQVLAGWLHNTARHEALHVVRTEARRRAREEAFAMMQPDNHQNTAIAEMLELALAELKAPERDILVLRFLEERPLPEVGREMAIAEDAARMRVNRALEKLRLVLEKRGLAVSTGILTLALASEARALLPDGLRDSVLATALANASSSGAAGAAASELFAWLNLKTAAAAIGVIVLIGTGSYLIYTGPVRTANPPSEARTPGRPAPLPNAGAAGQQAPTAVTAASSSVTAEGEEPPTAMARALVAQAILLMTDGRYEDARELLVEALDSSPRYPEAYLVLGKTLAGLGRLQPADPGSSAARDRERLGLTGIDNAEASFTRAVTLRPGFAEAWFERSRVHARLQQHEMAGRDCTAAIDLDGGYAVAWLGRGEARYQLNDRAGALIDLDRALELDANLAEGYHFRALIYMERGEPETALDNRRKAIEVDPGNARQHFRLAQTLRVLLRDEEALSHLDRALDLDPALSAAYHVRFLTLLRLDRREEGLGDLSNHLRLEPQHHACFAQRGHVYLRLGQLEQALADFNHSILLHPQQPRTHACRGYIYRRLGRFTEAVAAVEEAIRQQPDYEYAHIQGAWAYWDQGRRDAALRMFSRALEINPKNRVTYEDRACLLSQMDRWEEAMADIAQAMNLAPDNVHLKFMHALGHLCLGDLPAALAKSEELLASKNLTTQQHLQLVVLVAYGRFERREDAAAQALLASVKDLNETVWPAPVARFARGEIDFEEVQRLAGSHTEQSEARVYAGWQDLVQGRIESARRHFRWMIDEGDPALFEFHLAKLLLARVEGGLVPEPKETP